MKLNLLLPASIFAAFYLCEAGPMRLQKRAAFYIANETACVVDNIVYSSGDPIPTDDPCEACKCRPPGFACVLKECRVKPGCRAVRHAGQCCPDYVCGCEHDGRMYVDGEEIRDAKNPCYVCHCQGSSIACAFVDCLFRADCPPVYVPGECCPEYSNCTRRDAPENTPLKENNPVPSLNLLPGLNDDSVIIVPEKIPTTPKAVPPTEIATHPPTQSSVATERSTEGNVPDVKISSELQTDTPSSVSAENEPALVTVVEKGFVEEAASSETEKDILSKDGINDKVEKNDEIILLNSETEIKKDEDFETTTLKIPVSSFEVVKDEEIKTASVTEAGQKAEAPENQSESVSTIAEIPATEKPVKNSAADNSKSLKLSDDTNITEHEKSEKAKEVKTETPVQVDVKTTETLIQPSTESSNIINSIASTKSEPESAENIAEESQIKPQSSLYSNNDKIKSETAETVTIVVHVKDKTKTTTETNVNTEHVTSESVTNATQENLLNSKDELKSTEPVKDDKTTSVEISSEVFTSATEPNKNILSTLSPLTDEKPKDAETRSEKSDSTSEAPQSTVSNDETTHLKTDDVSSTITTAQDKSVTELSLAEARAEEKETIKVTIDDLKVLETKEEEPKVSISIQTTTISEIDSKTDKVKENQTKHEGTTELSTEEASAVEIKAELKEGDTQSDDKGEKTSTETTPEKIVASTATTQSEIKTEARSAETESKENLPKNIETTTAVEIQEQKEGVTTELANQDIKTSAQTERPKTDSE